MRLFPWFIAATKLRLMGNPLTGNWNYSFNWEQLTVVFMSRSTKTGVLNYIISPCPSPGSPWTRTWCFQVQRLIACEFSCHRQCQSIWAIARHRGRLAELITFRSTAQSHQPLLRKQVQCDMVAISPPFSAVRERAKNRVIESDHIS